MTNKRRPTPNAPGGALGDVLDDLLAEGHLTPRQYAAGQRLLADMRAYHGSSSGLVGEVAEKVDTGVRQRLWPPGGPSGIVALDQRLNRLLPHERQLMAFLVKHREIARGSLSDYGRIHSGYRTAKTTRAVAVGRVGSFLDTVADVYLGAERA